MLKDIHGIHLRSSQEAELQRKIMRGAQFRNQIHSFFPKRNDNSLRLAIDRLKHLRRSVKRLHQPASRDACDSCIVNCHAVLTKHLQQGVVTLRRRTPLPDNPSDWHAQKSDA
jgi:hypothetical protein